MNNTSKDLFFLRFKFPWLVLIKVPQYKANTQYFPLYWAWNEKLSTVNFLFFSKAHISKFLIITACQGIIYPNQELYVLNVY